jgi:hypothetical protein
MAIDPMTMMAIGSATTGLAGGLIGARGASDGAGRSKRAQAQFLRYQLDQAARQERIAGQLEMLANKMLNDEPLNPNEMNLLNAARQMADKQIQTATQESIEQALGAQAGMGFLKSGRAADQIRKLSLEGATARQQVALSREQAIQQGIERQKQQAMGLLGAAGQMNVSNINLPQMASRGSLMGSALMQLGGAGLSYAANMPTGQTVVPQGSPQGSPNRYDGNNAAMEQRMRETNFETGTSQKLNLGPLTGFVN